MNTTKLFSIIIVGILPTSCAHKYLPIVKTERYYPPVIHAKIVDQIPAGAIYIGTIKMVPRDYAFPTSRDINKALNNMLEAAAHAGARYVYIRQITAPSSDYYSSFARFVSSQFGEGLTVEAELFR